MSEKDKLNQELAKAIGVITTPPFTFSDTELVQIFNAIESLPEAQRNQGAWQDAVKKFTGIDKFYITEGIDLSDLEYLRERIKQLLK